jgi:hypothetical protein
MNNDPGAPGMVLCILFCLIVAGTAGHAAGVGR